MDASLRQPLAAPVSPMSADLGAGPVLRALAADAFAAVALQGVSWGPKGQDDILTDVSFAVPEGQVVAVCGANGAGKSSLLRLIYRHHAPRRGEVRLMGQDLWKIGADQAARQVAAVLQDTPGELDLTVRQIVALGRLPHRRGWGAGLARPEAGAAVEAALERMDLARLAERRFATLSGGERQRAMVARALAQEPRVIVLDEPTNHLDIRHQLDLLHLLRGLGLTVIASLHDLTLAAGFADRVLVLHGGRLFADGPPAAALDEAVLHEAFRVRAVVDRSGPRPRFSFHL